MKKNKKRIHCSNEKFLEAVYSSKTYAEVSSKTGQRITSTMARYSRTKKALAEKGVDLPDMQRKKPVKSVDNVENMIEIVQRLRTYHSNN